MDADREQVRALHAAARTGDLAVLRDLLSAGVSVEAPDEDHGRTPLVSACLGEGSTVETAAFLLEQGADVNARTSPPPEPPVDYDTLLDDEGFELDPEIRAFLEEERKSDPEPPDRQPVLAEVVQHAGIDTLRLLIAHGADVRYRSSKGYTLLTLAACASRKDAIDLLLAHGAPVDGESNWGESALSVSSRMGQFQTVAKLLAHGADQTPLQWSPLMRAVALGTPDEVAALLAEQPDLEVRDRWHRTPLLLAIHAGDREKAALLLASGADRDATGNCERPPASYPCENDDRKTLQWLIERGFAIDRQDQFGNTPLMEATSAGSPACFRLLTEAGADWSIEDQQGERLVPKAAHPEIIEMLHQAGEDLAGLESENLRAWIGLGNADSLPVSEEEYLEGREPRFGTANPERMDLPFWHAMVRCGWNAYRAARQFGDSSIGRDQPVWCHDRFGMSLTRLPDGRFVQVAGEHEDHYDPDFCIYNDVIVHDGKGGVTIYGYPREAFPPTDFHSATLVDEWIYLIGSLGYPEDRVPQGPTPVFRLHTGSFVIEKVAADGPSPGWIHDHQAPLENGLIVIRGGKRLIEDDDGEHDIVPQTGTYRFDPARALWEDHS